MFPLHQYLSDLKSNYIKHTQPLIETYTKLKQHFIVYAMYRFIKLYFFFILYFLFVISKSFQKNIIFEKQIQHNFI